MEKVLIYKLDNFDSKRIFFDIDFNVRKFVSNVSHEENISTIRSGRYISPTNIIKEIKDDIRELSERGFQLSVKNMKMILSFFTVSMRNDILQDVNDILLHIHNNLFKTNDNVSNENTIVSTKVPIMIDSRAFTIYTSMMKRAIEKLFTTGLQFSFNRDAEDIILANELVKQPDLDYLEEFMNSERYKIGEFNPEEFETVRFKNSPIITFRERWSSRVEAELVKLLEEKIPKKIYLTLYGLRQDRGIRFTFESCNENYKLFYPPFERITNEEMFIGCPYDFRNDYSVFEKFKEDFVKWLLDDIKLHEDKICFV